MQAEACKNHNIPICHLRACDCHKTLISWIENPGRFKGTSWNMKIMWVELEGTSVARTSVGLATPASTHFQRDNDCFRSLNGKRLETTHTTYTRSAKDNYRLIAILYTIGHTHVGTGLQGDTLLALLTVTAGSVCKNTHLSTSSVLLVIWYWDVHTHTPHTHIYTHTHILYTHTHFSMPTYSSPKLATRPKILICKTPLQTFAYSPPIRLYLDTPSEIFI